MTFESYYVFVDDRIVGCCYSLQSAEAVARLTGGKVVLLPSRYNPR